MLNASFTRVRLVGLLLRLLRCCSECLSNLPRRAPLLVSAGCRAPPGPPTRWARRPSGSPVYG
eukprot:8016053-Pyramimonas_sp.AAC.1